MSYSSLSCAGPESPTHTYAVTTDTLTKRYGDTNALNGVSLSIPQGSIYGFLGKNGAGKTTLIRILLGFTRATSGTARILGEKSSGSGPSLPVKKRMGFLPDVPGFYPWMNASETLKFAADIYAIAPNIRRERISNLLEITGLSRIKGEVGGYSRGMKQRLGLAQALINAPDLLILDEPTSALDPLGRREILDVIASLRGRATVMFSTHLLSDAQDICDHVGILDQGLLKAEGTLKQITQTEAQTRIAITAGNSPKERDHLRSRYSSLPWCTHIDNDANTLILHTKDTRAAGHDIPRIIAEEKMQLIDMRYVSTSLENAFLAITQKVSE